MNKALTSWRVPANDLDEDHPVTLRGLLSMTAGIGVPGFLGYTIDTPLPTLTQILDGAPPANSPLVTEAGCLSSRRPCGRCSPRRTAVRMGSAPRSLNKTDRWSS